MGPTKIVVTQGYELHTLPRFQLGVFAALSLLSFVVLLVQAEVSNSFEAATVLPLPHLAAALSPSISIVNALSRDCLTDKLAKLGLADDDTFQSESIVSTLETRTTSSPDSTFSSDGVPIVNGICDPSDNKSSKSHEHKSSALIGTPTTVKLHLGKDRNHNLQGQSSFVISKQDQLDEDVDLIGVSSPQHRAPHLMEKPLSSLQANLFTLPSLDWIREHLGTKSPYPHGNRPVGLLVDTPEGYELVQLHLICRHGTRYPSSSKSAGFKKLADRLKNIKLPGFEWLKDWPSDTLYPIERGNLLAVQGDADLYQIGNRFAIRYKSLLDSYPYDANTYEFTSSAKSRCSQSAYGFSVGFFEGRLATDPKLGGNNLGFGNKPPVQPIEISMLPIGMDKELAVKYACRRWLENIKDKPRVVHESQQFSNTFLPALADRLSAVLSTNAKSSAGMVNITVKDVGVIQNLCGFEIAMHGNDQTWCRLLGFGLSNVTEEATEGDAKKRRMEDIKRVFEKLEIASDLDDYYTHGPGVPFNKHLGCPLATSMISAIEMALTDSKPKSKPIRAYGDDDDDGEPKLFRGIFKFGHSETILFFSSFLGLYNQKGIPLTADMTPEQYTEREFWTSRFSPFAANMAFEVFRPTAPYVSNDVIASSRRARQGYRRWNNQDTKSTDDTPSSTPRGLIRLLVNEVPVLLPGCGSDYFCEWSTFKKVLQSSSINCDFDSCCSTLQPIPGKNPSPTSNPSHIQSRQNKDNPSPGICLAVDPIIK
ncbi:PHOsphatase [Linnemannia zychae]|nr:PHOsphatase [Linnemannia zychae]